MARYVFRLDDGKTIVIDPRTDECIYEAPMNPPNTGTRYTRGTDLYLHRTRSGRKVFYLKRWSMWQGEETSYELISEEEAKNFFLERLGMSGWMHPSEEEIQRALELWPDLMEETA